VKHLVRNKFLTSPQYVRVYRNIPERPILAFELCLIVMKRLPVAQSLKDVVYSFLIRVKFGYVMANVFLELISKHIKFCLIYPGNHSIGTNPMDAYRSVLQRITQISFMRNSVRYLSGMEKNIPIRQVLKMQVLYEPDNIALQVNQINQGRTAPSPLARSVQCAGLFAQGHPDEKIP
jgi:hypothetical protein